MMGRMFLLVCSIRASAFSGERVFRFKMLDGREYCGTAPAHYFRGPGRERLLPRGEPEAGKSMEGYVEAWRIGGDEGQAMIRLPDNEVVAVNSMAIPFVMEENPTSRYIPARVTTCRSGTPPTSS